MPFYLDTHSEGFGIHILFLIAWCLLLCLGESWRVTEMMWFCRGREETENLLLFFYHKAVFRNPKERTVLVCPWGQGENVQRDWSQRGDLTCSSMALGKDCSSFQLQNSLCIFHLWTMGIVSTGTLSTYN